ncbi:hypothetical protein Atu0426 [Agrobacterium fabrum str. C58]|uniref:Uncharacterized protein n=1 Tax=Agrobacterium fabrum (strain C58 / ATCC 33970) TaxID=176299 RepID=Q8UI73_AGRFC|nr:hypothetical protein Atu0426 [Agrobacterium fabrum str. C58]
MELAIGRRFQRFTTAEMEIIFQGVADRPLAGALRQFRQRQATGNRGDDVSGRNVIENFCSLDADLFLKSRCRVGTRQDPGRCRADTTGEIRRARGRGGGALGRGTRRSDRTAGLDASRQIETVNLADNGITADTAQLRCYLAGAKSLGPQFLEFLDSLVCPVHAASPLFACIVGRIPLRPAGVPQAWFPPDFR